MLFDPTLQRNKLEIKLLTIHSLFLDKSPVFSEMPYKFSLSDFGKTGLDVLFYGQEHFDTISILDDKRDISKDNIGQFMKQQRILSNRELMLKNFNKLIESLTECELYIQKVIDG